MKGGLPRLTLGGARGERAVTASGWLAWAPDEVSAHFTVTVIQATVAGTATFTASAPESTWQAVVRSGDEEFRIGEASCRVHAVVHTAGGGTTAMSWEGPSPVVEPPEP